MELRQLEYFQMVARYRNITRAATHLNVSQPNITVSIKKLENELGVTLFDRGQKHLTLTPEGELFLNRTASAMKQIKDAINEIDDYRELKKGSISIGIPSMIGSFLFDKIFSDFKKLYPYIDVYIYEEGSMAIRGMLERVELDLGIVILSNVSNKLEKLPMASAQVVCCMSENNALAQKPYHSISDLENQNLIMLKEGSYLRNVMMNTIHKAGIDTKLILESNQVDTIKSLTASNVGITFPFHFLPQGSHGIKIVPMETPVIVDIGIAWKKDRYISRACHYFIDFYREIMQNNNL